MPYIQNGEFQSSGFVIHWLAACCRPSSTSSQRTVHPRVSALLRPLITVAPPPLAPGAPSTLGYPHCCCARSLLLDLLPPLLQQLPHCPPYPHGCLLQYLLRLHQSKANVAEAAGTKAAPGRECHAGALHLRQRKTPRGMDLDLYINLPPSRGLRHVVPVHSTGSTRPAATQPPTSAPTSCTPECRQSLRPAATQSPNHLITHQLHAEVKIILQAARQPRPEVHAAARNTHLAGGGGEVRGGGSQGQGKGKGVHP